MIKRYATPEMEKLWSNENKLTKWLETEMAVCYGWYKAGKINEKDWTDIKNSISFDEERVMQLETITKHDVAAFVQNLQESVPEACSRFIHFGITSSDILDTSLALLLRDALGLIDKEIYKLMELLEQLAVRFKHTPCAGRTHGIQAEPMSFGLKFLVWLDDFSKHQENLRVLKKEISTGKVSGAIGTYATVPPLVEKHALEYLKLDSAVISTQILQRESYARFVSFMALIAATIEKIAVELRHLQRSEVREFIENFTPGQKGSSAMPHKKNPVSSENLSGLARVVRGYSLTALENVVLWHERDISHSSAERIILPDSSSLVLYMLRRLCDILDNASFSEERMLYNLNSSRGLIYSQRVLLALIDKGLSRSEAYEIVQRNALSVWNDDDCDLYSELAKEAQVKELFDDEELISLFDNEMYFQHACEVYERFGL